MKRALRYLLTLALMTSLTAVGADCCTTNNCDDCCSDDCSYVGQCDGYPYLQFRSQGRNSARELVGWQQFVNRTDTECYYGAFSAAVEYSRSFRNERLAHGLFGNDLVNCCKLLIQGSDVANRNPKAWMADYFGLPSEYSSEITFCPEIQNAIVDLDFYFGLDEWKEGLFFRVNAPIVWTKWSLCPKECNITTTSKVYPAGYLAETALETTALNSSFMGYMKNGNKVGDISPIKYSKFNNCACTKTRLAEVDFTLGYNFYRDEDAHAGISVYLGAPAGNRPCGTYIFEPMVGNGKHWELGVGFTGSWIFWRDCECEDQYLGLWLEATVAHLFKACQTRSFDFKCKPNSRYMLLEQMETADGKLTGEGAAYTAATYQYAKNLIPAVNWSTFNVDVKIPVVADIAIKLGYVNENWSADLGYNLWARTGEKFCDGCCSTNSLYAMKGEVYVYGQVGAEGAIVPLSNTDSTAKIYGSTTPDNLVAAYYDGTVVNFVGTEDALKTSIQPVLVNKSMLNMGKSPCAITHKVFGNISYAWKDCDCECDDWTPFFGIGGEVEFAQDNYKDCCCCDSSCNTCCDTTCSTCDTSSSCSTNCDSSCDCSPKRGLSIWGIWVKGGIAFN